MKIIDEGPRWFLSTHALGRMAEMGVSREQVEQTLRHPEFDVPDLKHGQGDRRRAYGSLLVVPYAGDVVISVLWRSDDRPFVRGEARPC